MKVLITALLALTVFISCNKNAKETAADYNNLERKVDQLADFNTDKTDGITADTATQQVTGNQQKKNLPVKESPHPDWDKKIIKNGILSLEVKDYNAYSASCRDKIRGLGGYVAQEEQHQSDYKIENTLVIRVPVDQFDNAMNQLVLNTEKVNERKVTSQDVTGEFTDTKSRIEAKKQVRQRYIELMNQAKNMEEILTVQSEINQVQEEIEAATGRINYLGNAAAYSTITITFFQVLNENASDTKDDVPPFGERVGTAFKTGWNWITELLVGLVSVWPLFIIIAGLIILYKKSKAGKPKPAA